MEVRVLHVDLDQFLAAVEVLRRPELRGRPVVVGGDGDPTHRGVVSTASYEARAHGVGSGVPLRTAARRCPDAVFLPLDRPAYEAASEAVLAVLREVADAAGAAVEVLGWDEAFLGPGGTPAQAQRLAEQIRSGVLAATGLHCSVGIGDNRLQAKTATAFAKPDGVHRLDHETWAAQVGPLPTRALWGVGAKTAKRLAALGIGTVSELAAADPDRLAEDFGPATGPWLVRLAQGRDSARVSPEPRAARSRSRELTYQVDVEVWDAVRQDVVRLARQVAGDLSADGGPPAVSRMVVKVRYRPFTTVTHGARVSPDGPVPHADRLVAAALAAFDRFTARGPVRLVGVRAELVAPAAG